MMDSIHRALKRLPLIIGRGRILLVDDSGPAQRLQVRLGADELVDRMPHLQQYGIQSSPPPGTDVAAIFINGERSNGLAIACGNKTLRIRNLATGEVAISDDKGQKVYLSADGIKVDGGGLPVDVSNTPSVTITADSINLVGSVTVRGPMTLIGPLTQLAGRTSGSASSLVGPLTVTGDVTTAGINLTTHTHGGIVRGSGRTDGPL